MIHKFLYMFRFPFGGICDRSLDITPPKTDKSPFKRCLEDKPFLLSHGRRGVSSHLGGIEPKAVEVQTTILCRLVYE